MDFLTTTEYSKIMKQCIDSYTKEEILTIPEVYQAVSRRLHGTVMEIYAKSVIEEQYSDKRKENIQNGR